MRFYLLVEGYTEKAGVGGFLKRWLDERLGSPIGIRPVRHDGWSSLVRDLPKTVQTLLNADRREKVAGVVALLDLYGPTFYPDNKKTVKQRIDWARDHFEKQIGDRRFRMFFAVHEIEAWLLSEPQLFSSEIVKALPGKIAKPEEVNFNEHPSDLLEKTYKKVSGGKRKYDKVNDGRNLLAKLNPEAAYLKCPHLQILLDEMLEMAKLNGNPD